MSEKYDLKDRLLNFSRNISKIVRRLPNYPECIVLRRQLFSAATSIGANYEEADGSLTKKRYYSSNCNSKERSKRNLLLAKNSVW